MADKKDKQERQIILEHMTVAHIERAVVEKQMTTNHLNRAIQQQSNTPPSSEPKVTATTTPTTDKK
ncbi:hypothetical protein ACLI1C_15425 [Devosia sp. XGJD_8]|uniref:hypothetical protein n=1 Tax=Devosia sp. XGJD_8 TaxID=3391187 RepID=UPI0039852882